MANLRYKIKELEDYIYYMRMMGDDEDEE